MNRPTARVFAATRSPRLTLAARRAGVMLHLNELVRLGAISGGALAFHDMRVRMRADDLAATWHILHTAPKGWGLREVDGAYRVTVRPEELEFVVPYGLLADAMGSLIERFLLDEYAALDVEGAVVVDIGAYIGDSAVYLVRRGARRVYSYEPFPQLAAVAEKNATVNGLGDVITVSAAGVGWPVGQRRASFKPSSSMMSSTVSGAGGDFVDIRSFDDVLDGVVAKHPDSRIVCKVDCEGAEREFFRVDAWPRSFTAVDGLALEWHDPQPGPVVDELRRRGFEVNTAPTSSQDGAPTMIFATRTASPAG